MSVSPQTAGSSLPAVTLEPAILPEPLSVYGRTFWCAYVSNAALMVAITIMYRYADFIVFLGGNEWNVGRIVGVGMIGSLFMRFLQGQGIDRFGARQIWVLSMAGYVLSLIGHVYVTDVNGPAIYVLRTLYATSVAGAFGASITCVSRSLPLDRMAEVIGSLGTSAFIAMGIGSQLGDIICGEGELTRGRLNTMFLVSAALGAVSLVCAEFATRSEIKPRKRKTPHLFWLLRRYHPGSVMMMGVVIGIGFVLPNVFLPTYAKELGIPKTGPFFLAYAFTAFVTRVATRRTPQKIGVRPMVFAGLVAAVVSLFLYLPVRSSWGLMLPGVFAGIAHAVLFPAVTAQGSAAFPNRYRGLGTTLMLAMLDVGALVGAPLVGGLVEYSKTAGLPPYPTTFCVLGVGIVLSGLFYALTDRT